MVTRKKKPSFKDEKSMLVVLKRQVELGEDIATFGLVCMAKIG